MRRRANKNEKRLGEEKKQMREKGITKMHEHSKGRKERKENNAQRREGTRRKRKR